MGLNPQWIRFSIRIPSVFPGEIIPAQNISQRDFYPLKLILKIIFFKKKLWSAKPALKIISF